MIGEIESKVKLRHPESHKDLDIGQKLWYLTKTERNNKEAIITNVTVLSLASSFATCDGGIQRNYNNMYFDLEDAVDDAREFLNPKIKSDDTTKIEL